MRKSPKRIFSYTIFLVNFYNNIVIIYLLDIQSLLDTNYSNILGTSLYTKFAKYNFLKKSESFCLKFDSFESQNLIEYLI